MTPYPFDPHDPSTVTALYAALRDAEVDERSFPAWFDTWNALDLDIHDAWTVLKRRTYSDTSDVAAGEAYRVFTREVFSTFQEHHMALVAKALSVSPTPPSPSFAALWRRWDDGVALFRPEHVTVQARISELEGSYREFTRRLEAGEGEAPPRWLEHRAALNDLMLELLTLRHSLASASGEASFLTFRLRELGRLDFPAASWEVLHAAVDRLVLPEVVKLRGQAEPGEPPVGDLDALLSGVEAMFTGLDPDFGRVIRGLRPDFVDLGRRPNKADTNEQWFFPRAGRAYLHATSGSVGTLLHECGHAVHATLAFEAHPSLWNAYAPDEFQEFAATAFELLCWPLYGEAGFSPEQCAALHVRHLRFYLSALLETAREDAFEYAMYGEAPPKSGAEIDELWLTVTRRFFPWRTGDDDLARTGWQRGNWSLFRIPLYQSAYTVAIVGALLLARRTQADRAGVLGDFKAALTLGATAPLPELFGRVGLRFPFGEEDVKEAVAFALERLAHFTPLADRRGTARLSVKNLWDAGASHGLATSILPDPFSPGRRKRGMAAGRPTFQTHVSHRAGLIGAGEKRTRTWGTGLFKDGGNPVLPPDPHVPDPEGPVPPLLRAGYAAGVTLPTTLAPAPPRRLAAAGLGIFLLLGLIYPILGPALPTLSDQFRLSARGASLLLSFNSAGAFAGVLLAGALARRWPPPWRAVLALGVITAGSLGLSLAPTFGPALAASLLLGLGFGVLDVTTNVWVSTSYGARSASMLNLLSASFGVGAVLAPLAVGLAGGDFRLPLLGCAALAALLLPLLVTLRGVAPGDVVPDAGGAARADGRSRALLLGFVLLFLTYVGVEGGIGAWEVTHLQGVLGLSTADAASLTSLFWVSFTAGRLISAALALRLPPARLVTLALALAALSLALAAVPAAAWAAYTLAGLFLAPVFTTGLVWLTRTLPGSGATTLVFASAFLGPVVFSPVVGAFKDTYGAGAIPVTLLGITLLCLGVALGLRRALRS